jgi:hypothetical protein
MRAADANSATALKAGNGRLDRCRWPIDAIRVLG